jgi:serine protease Do
MKCPSCGNEQVNSVECERCGIIFEKYRIRQQRLADAKAAREEQAQKKKPISGLLMGLTICLLLGGGAFYFYGNSDKTAAPPVDVASQASQQSVPAQQEQQREVQKQIPPPSSNQSNSNTLDGLAKQLNESHPANTSIEKARNATVYIKTSWGSGSGFFISDNGLIVTNKHVLQMQTKDLDSLNANADKGAKALDRGEKR